MSGSSIEFKISGPPEIAHRLAELFALLTTNTALVREIESLKGAVKAMSDTLASQLAQVKVELAALTSKVADSDLTLNTFSGALAAAIAAGGAKGLTPEQLQDFSDIHAGLTAATASLDSTIKANPLPIEIPPAAEPTP